jgi:hypothetical protein
MLNSRTVPLSITARARDGEPQAIDGLPTTISAASGRSCDTLPMQQAQIA